MLSTEKRISLKNIVKIGFSVGISHAWVYRYGFNGQEKDDETYGEGNAYDFGARIYSPRLGKWLKIDPQAAKYVSLSPFHFGNNNPIITIDPNGEENIIVIGGPGGHVNRFNFAESAIRQAKDYQLENKFEKTTLIIMNSGYSPEEIDQITKISIANGLGSPIIVNSAKEVVNYVNTQSTEGSSFPGSLSKERISDPVTDLSFFAHGTPEGIQLGWDGPKMVEGRLGNELASKMSPYAFQKETNEEPPQIDLYSCNGATGYNDEKPVATTLNNQTGAQVTAFSGQSTYMYINVGNSPRKDGQMYPNGAVNAPVAGDNGSQVVLPAKK